MMPNSLKYVVFLALAAAGHAIAPKKLRNPLLLAVSWAFYLLSMPRYLPLMIAVTGATFLTAKWMESHPAKKTDGPGLFPAGLLRSAVCL